MGSTVKVQIVYGYRRRFEGLSKELERQLPGLEISGEKVKGRAGCFKVIVEDPETGKELLLHSKEDGDGFVDDDEKMAKIVKALQKMLG